jgi:putative transposase
MRKSIKNASRRKAIQGRWRSESPRKVGLREVLVNARASLREVVLSSGLQVLAAMLEEDRERLCGPRSRPWEERGAYRHGHDEAPVVLGGRKVRVSKPRVRSVDDQEVELPTWRQMTEEDPLEERAVEQMLVGVSTRGYARSLEALPEEMESVGVSRSSVSRRFVARTAREVEVFLGRELEGIDLPVVMVDGTELGEHVLVTALGIDSTGKKQVLGVREGSTENEQLCLELLRSLVERGLVVERARLFVIDGGKGIRKAIRGVFGSWALVQRCQVHYADLRIMPTPDGKHARAAA